MEGLAEQLRKKRMEAQSNIDSSILTSGLKNLSPEESAKAAEIVSNWSKKIKKEGAKEAANYLKNKLDELRNS